MLVLIRKPEQAIILETSDGPIRVLICGFKHGQVKVGVEAPDKVRVRREELER